MRVLAAAPWTYWMALPILVIAVCTLMAFVGVYLKKVVEPRLLYEDQPRAPELAGTRGRSVVAPDRIVSEPRSPGAVGGRMSAAEKAGVGRTPGR